jgi:predicted dehydrogenase
MVPRPPARIAVVGCGSWANEAHLPALAANPDAEIVALVETREAALDAAARKFGVEHGYPEMEVMLAESKPEGVVIAVPHVHHFAAARAALESGAHVLLEKPMVLDPNHGRELMALARRQGRELIIGYPWHYNPQSRTLRAALSAGRIGRLEFIACLFGSTVRELYRGRGSAYDAYVGYAGPQDDTYSDPALAGGGQGQTQLTHSAALLFWLTGLRPVRVSAFTESFELAVDLCDAVSVRFEGGEIGVVGSTGSMPVGHPDALEYRLFGTEGYVCFDVMQGRLAIRGRDGAVEELQTIELADRYPHFAPANNLVDVILDRGVNESPAEIGQLTVEFLDSMYRSAATGGAAVDVTSRGSSHESSSIGQ